MVIHRLAAAMAVLVLVPVALLGGGYQPAAAEEKCPGSSNCIVYAAPLGDCWEADDPVGNPATSSEGCSLSLTPDVPLWRDVEVRYSTYPGTASDGKDYQGVKEGSTIIPAGAKVAYLELVILPDEEQEPDEYFYLRFVSPWDGVTVKPDVVKVVIHDGS